MSRLYKALCADGMLPRCHDSPISSVGLLSSSVLYGQTFAIFTDLTLEWLTSCKTEPCSSAGWGYLTKLSAFLKRDPVGLSAEVLGRNRSCRKVHYVRLILLPSLNSVRLSLAVCVVTLLVRERFCPKNCFSF